MKHNTIIIKHLKFGKLVQQTFENHGQFKLFLMGIHGSLELKTAMTFYNGDDFLVNIPFKILCQSVIITKYISERKSNSLSEHFKSRMEAEVIKES